MFILLQRASLHIVSADITKKKRETILHNVFASQNCSVVVTSYHLLSNMVDLVSGLGSWDYLVLDEGHVIKNPQTKISKSVHQVPCNHRLLLTGM